MSQKLRIGYAYGASAVDSVAAKRAFTQNVKTTFEWAEIDWRPFLPGPEVNALGALRNRFTLPPPPAPQRSSSADDEGTKAMLVVEGPRFLGDMPSSDGSNEQWATVDAATSAEDEGFGPGLGTLARVVIDRRGFARDFFSKGIFEVGTTIADILNYMDRRDTVRGHLIRLVTSVLHDAPGRAVLVGESLGGIMLVDALAQMQRNKDDLSKLDLLITFASQSAALVAIRPGGAPPEVEPFTPWANVWHRDDFLSYPTQGTFNQDDIRDHEAQHGSLFPEVHTQYLTDPKSRLFEYVNDELAAVVK
jgi:hypothetical protein